MKTTFSDSQIEFTSEEKTAGIYVLDDPFKPFFRKLYTPAGHNVVDVSPVDHRHHKGLMFALKTNEVNFWEEFTGDGSCGVQEIVSTEAIEGGFRQELLWREEQGSFQTYKEIRTITGVAKSATAYEWTWKTERTALRDHTLEMSSFWLLELEDGRKVNYHGLGARLPWSWRWGPQGKKFGAVEMNGETVPYLQASGTTAEAVGLRGMIDGHWAPPMTALTIKQDQEYGWFAFRDKFAYLSVGPSIFGEVEVSEGQIFDETYTITVEDR